MSVLFNPDDHTCHNCGEKFVLHESCEEGSGVELWYCQYCTPNALIMGGAEDEGNPC